MSGYQVGPETFLTLRCQVFDAEGEEACEPEILGAAFGFAQLLPEVEKALEGHSEGEVVEVRLKSTEAFGQRDPKRILEVDRSEFPSSVAEGDRFEVENDQGGVLVVHVLELLEDSVVLDTNHPLADQELRYVVEICEVRPANEDELHAAEALMEEDSAFLRAEVPDVSAAQLIRGK